MRTRTGRIAWCFGPGEWPRFGARSPGEKDRLFDVSTAGGCVFLGHLRRYLIFFQEDPDLAEAMKAIIREEGCKNLIMVDRLEAAGLARENDNGKIAPFCRLYAEYFNR